MKDEGSQRLKHDGINKEDERLKEIEDSGLFALVEKSEYLVKTRNDAEGYLKAMNSVPAFASILDGMDDMIIKSMENEIKVAINELGGYVNSFLNFSLYITKKMTK